MATKQLVSKVWIAPGCIVCDACETTCPEVFDVQETTCLIRPEALDAEFCKPLSQSIVEAAEECPVEVIKFDATEIEVPDAPAVPIEAVPTTVAAAPVERSAGGVEVEASKSAAEVDPSIAALLKATTSRGGKAGHQKGPSSPAAVRALRARPITDLPPDARYEKMLEAAKAEKSAARVSRRAVITAAGVGWVAFGATSAVGGAVLQRFMMPNVLEEPDPRIRVGQLTQFAEMPIGGVNEDFKPQGIWIIRVEGAIAALSTTCTHLGCIPNWLAADRKFKCPCHGSGYMQTGINFEGPAPRPLERYKVSVEEGILVVDKSKKFQQEKGEWANPDSFVTV